MKPKQIKANYAVACMLNEDLQELFFVTFNTRDETLALELSRCIVGDNAEKCLMIINEYGEIYEL